MAKSPTQFTPESSIESVRSNLDSKIEKRVTNEVFYWACSLVVLFFAGTYALLIPYIMKISETQNKINVKVAVIEEKLNKN